MVAVVEVCQLHNVPMLRERSKGLTVAYCPMCIEISQARAQEKRDAEADAISAGLLADVGAGDRDPG